LISSTIYDIIARRAETEPNQLFIAFSIYTNGKVLFDVAKSKSPDSINCLLGLRAISVFWIIFGHRFTSQMGFRVTNPREVTQHFTRLYSAILSSFNIAVDTFFVMGALLMTISTLKALDKKTLNIPRMIFHRYIRYTPVFAILILYVVAFSQFTFNGPIQADEVRQNCIDNWWTSLLHIQNYIFPLEQCLGHAW
jgi:peptidoglycan/LPS O-acetylase OafA/YrhL